jgi:lipopolysaccharide transport system permease protein
MDQMQNSFADLESNSLQDEAVARKQSFNSWWHSERGYALNDIISGLKQWHICQYMAIADIKRRYRRTIIGPFWTTLSLAIFIGSMSLLFSQLWKTDIATFLPFFSSGFICWVFISSIITESSTAFIVVESLLKQVCLPFSIFAWLVVLRNLLVLAHHSIVYFFIVLIFSVPINLNLLLTIPALLLLCLTGFWVSIFMGTVCARYRDLQQVINSLLQISMFVTPIFWPTSQLAGNKALQFLNFNPLYHYISIVRLPLLGQAPSLINWLVVISITVIGALLTFFFFARQRRKLIFWL